VLVHQITSYNKSALWDAVKNWFDGGGPASGAVDSRGACVHSFTEAAGRPGGSMCPIHPRRKGCPWPGNPSPALRPSRRNTFGYRWNFQLVKRDDSREGPRVTLPEFFHLVTNKNHKAEWMAVQAQDVPAETGLVSFGFEQPVKSVPNPTSPLTSP